jgi:hypothetical protein
MSKPWMDRADHLKWSKKRALALIKKGDIRAAVYGMAADLRKHPKLKDMPSISVMIAMFQRGHMPYKEEASKIMEGFS